MSLLDSTQITTKVKDIDISTSPSYKQAANRVCNMVQVHTTSGPVILPPYHQELLYQDAYVWKFENYYIDWATHKRAALFDGRCWL